MTVDNDENAKGGLPATSADDLVTGNIQEIMNALPMALFVKDPDGRIVLMNKTCEEQWGCSFNDIRGTVGGHLFPPAQLAGFIAKDREVFASGKQDVFNESIPNARTGENIIAQTVKKPLYDAIGKPLCLIGMSLDITDRARSALEYQAILKTTQDGFWVNDLRGRFLDVNEVACRMLGYERNEMLKMSIPDVEALEQPDDTSAHIERILATGSDRFETRHRHKDGHVLEVEVTVNYIPVMDGRLIVFVRDITDRKAYEAAVLDYQEKVRNLAAHSNLMVEAERKRIAREVHDEIGQLLTVLKIDLQLCKLAAPENHPIQQGSDEMLSLIDRTITAVRDVTNNLRPPTLDIGLVPAVEWLIQDVSSRTALRFFLHVDPIEDHLDDAVITAIFRAVQESITNIIRHAAATEAVITLRLNEPSINLNISDNGRGFVVDRAYQTLGFGLMGMRERILSLGGVFNIYSEIDVGTTINIEVPHKK